MVNNLFLRLHKWAHRQDENFVTESFVFLLRLLLEREAPVGVELVRFLCGNDGESLDLGGQLPVVTTQTVVEEGRPDIRVEAPGLLAFVEVKVESSLGHRQVERYREALRRSGATIQRLVLMTRYPVAFARDDVVPDRQLRWHEVAGWLQANLPEDAPSRFLARQFLDFLKVRIMTFERVGPEYLKGVGALNNLTHMLGFAIEQTPDLGKPKPYTSAGYIGFHTIPPGYAIGVRLNRPDVLRMRSLARSFDRAKLIEAGGKVDEVNYDTPLFELHLDSIPEGFFTLPSEDQLAVLKAFLAESHRKIASCLVP